MQVKGNSIPGKPKRLTPLSFYLLSILIGIVGGIGAVIFRGMISFFHNLLFLGKLSVVYDANTHTPASPWGPLVILVPVLGALGVAFLIKNFAPEAKGHGVPEVMDAIYYHTGIIRPLVALIKSLASALSIGSGGSIGREGPIIQIGASFGSTLGQLIPMPVWQRITLVAAGAGAGIAATFNTPVGGVLFAIEIMLNEVSVRTLVPVAISTATATYIGRLAFGNHPSFVIPSFEAHYFHPTEPMVLIAYVGLGLILGGVSTLFIKSIYGFEDFFEQRVKGNYYTRHMAGMLLVGVVMYLLMVSLGHYYIEGVGYATVQDILTGALTQLPILLLLFVLKMVATSMTLGSGASGGIFSPALYLGATLGGAYGVVLHWLFPGLAISPAAFAVAGMAGLVGGTTGAAMAAIVMIFEMTLDYTVIIPITLTVALSYGIRKTLSRESIYTLKLVRRGHYMPEALQANVHFIKQAKDMVDIHFELVPASRKLKDFVKNLPKQAAGSKFLVEDDNQVIGLATRENVLGSADQFNGAATVGEIAAQDYITVTKDTTLLEIVARMRAERASMVLVIPTIGAVSADQVVGLITKEQIADALAETAELFSE